MNRSSLTVTVFALVVCSSTHATEVLRWERLPLAVPLVVGQERIVFIDRNVRVGVPTALGNRLRVQSAAGAVYLLANKPIKPVRLQLQDADTGAVILLDIAAEPAQDKQQPLEPVRIVEEPTTGSRYGVTAAAKEPSETVDSAAPQPTHETPIPVVLTRYAAQNLYAPLRTVEPVPGITRANLPAGMPLDTLLPTLPVHPKALATWHLDNLWVTAVRLSNTTPRWFDLDPRAIQGDFLTATFQHPSLGPVGTPEDTTVVYLVTRGHGLEQALLPTLSPINASLNQPAMQDGGRDAQ
ncbi:TIGR03749 family integrating conjugative element protein [Pseudomonas citronellolis]|uniref:TIGR03749 family integrating conjugative element protein n=1 Tax=Pseudomonas citronellolis TaxID=53408 RepID=UPI0021C0D411|nr:TIGR03749 family integrating conjugative element protein [Pseudomonas citronellolis]UXJ50135.1 TIGR03749 family integrating conjugative element protein [Pseudomonas citronellolis]